MIESHRHGVAMWAGLTALFTNFAALNLISFVGNDGAPLWQLLASTMTAIFVAASVYAKHRYDEAREERPSS